MGARAPGFDSRNLRNCRAGKERALRILDDEQIPITAQTSDLNPLIGRLRFPCGRRKTTRSPRRRPASRPP